MISSQDAKFVRPRPRPDGRYHRGRQLDPGPRDSPQNTAAEKTAAEKKASTTVGLAISGHRADPHALLTAMVQIGGESEHRMPPLRIEPLGTR